MAEKWKRARLRSGRPARPRCFGPRRTEFCSSCASGAAASHFRHAGHVHSLVPFMLSGGDKRIDADPKQVMVCVKCRASFVWLNSQAYDVTDQIDLEAWQRLEEDAKRATSPGGEC